MKAETLVNPVTRYDSPLDPIWDAVAQTADDEALAACSIDYRHGGGTGFLEVEIAGTLYRVEIREVETGIDLTTDEGQERFLAEAEAMAEQGYAVRVER